MMSLRQPLEELFVGDGAASIGLAVLLVEEHQVDVARIVQFQAAELAEGEHDEPARLPSLRSGRPYCSSQCRRA